RRVAIARKKKKSTCQSIIDYAQRSLGNIWWVYINYAQETFSFPFFRDLELSIVLIGSLLLKCFSTCHFSVRTT
ncbi:hypothetical protein C0J52_12995, partial [Blattella germanica]